MTVTTTTSRVSYSGNGSTTAFAVPFYFLANADLVVIRTTSTGTSTTLVLNTDYTASGAGITSGGTVTCTTAPAAGTTLVIYRNPAITQSVDYQPNDPFPAQTHEQALDRLTMIAQRQSDLTSRSFRLSDGDVSNASTTLPTPTANNFIGWNATATGLQNVTASSLATIVASSSAQADTFTGDGTTTAFTLTSNPGALANLSVSVGGVVQLPTTNYTWTSGTTLTFTTAPPNGVKVLVRYQLGLAQGYTDSAAVTYIPSGTGAVATTVQTKLRESVSVKDFGAVGDGVTNDTAAIQAALTAGQAQSKSIYFPAGTYSVSTLLMPLTSYLKPFGLIGEGPGVTKIQKRSSDGLALFTVGSTAATQFSTQLWIQGITFSGIAANTPAAVQLYDLVRSTFQQCVFQNSIAGCISSGGITNTYQNCIFQNNQIGIKFDKFTSLAGGGYPNHNSLKNCGIFDNSLQGIYFNNGRNLYISDCDIEGNGTSGNASTMGIYVANVNNESSGAAPAMGVSMLNCWLEANAGDAALQINSGVNTVRSCYFAANANATNDIHIVGGNYHLSEVAFGTNKVANLLESAGSSTGNSIVNSYDALVGIFSYDAAKTFIQGTWNSGSGVLKHTLLMRSGSVPVVMSTANPMIQTGTATTGGAGTVNVTFATAFASAPLVYASIVDASSTKTSGVQLSSISTTGFSILATYLQSGSSTVNVYASVTVSWVAIGATS